MANDIWQEYIEKHNKNNEWVAALRSGKIKEQKKESPPTTKPRIVSSKQLRAIRN